MTLAWGGVCLMLGGCGGGPPAIASDVISAPNGTASATVWGDWDDLDASIGSGMAWAEVTVLETTSSDDRRTWTLLTIENHSGLVTASRDPLAARDARGCERITLTAAVDADHGTERAARVVSGATERLKQLAGVAWAPRK